MQPKRLLTAVLILNLASTALAQTAQQYFDNGINHLTANDLDGANLCFSNAVVLAPANPTNNFFYALTSLVTLGDRPAGSNFLTDLGISPGGRNLFDWTATGPKIKGQLGVPVGVNANDFAAMIRTNVLPALTNAQANLLAITGPRFSVTLNPDETHLPEVTVDYGDVLMMEALDQAAVFCSYEMYSLNLNMELTDIATILTNKSIVGLLNHYPQALTTSTTNDFIAARTAYSNAINLYFAASQFIRVDRAPGVTRLFNLSSNEMKGELGLRETLTNILTSLSGPPVTLTVNSNMAVSAAALFSATNGGLRPFFPQLQGNEFVWGTFPDVTLGGMIYGLNQADLGCLMRIGVSAALDAPGVGFTAVCDITNSAPIVALALNTDGNLYGAMTYDGFDGNYPYYGDYGNGSICKTTPSGVFTTLYSFDNATNAEGQTLAAYPNSLVAGGDGYLYGTTQYGGSNVLITVVSNFLTNYYNFPGQGAIFKISTNGISTLLHAFEPTGVAAPYGYIEVFFTNGAFPSGVFATGEDGNLYGTTLYRDWYSRYKVTNGYQDYLTYSPATIFKVAPSGTFSTIYLFGSNQYDGGSASSLAVSSNGTIFAASPNGGINYDGAILKITSTGHATLLYSFGTETDDFGNPLDGMSPNSLILGADGNLYGTAQYGGANQEGTAFRLTQGGSFTTLHSFSQSLTNGGSPVGSLAQAPNGVLYGTSMYGGANKQGGAIYAVTTNGAASTVAWFDYDSGNTLSAGLIPGMDGNIYGATSSGGEYGNGAVFSLFSDSLQISPLAGFAASGAPDGPFTPSSQIFVLSNVGPASITWSAGSAVPWLNLSSSSGKLTPGASANVTVSLIGAANLNLGSYIGTVLFTNTNDAIVQSRQFTVSAGNASFQTGTFQDWTLGGDTSYTFVGSALDWPNYVWSGNCGAVLGTSGGVGTLSQTVPTVAGQSYLISFWFCNPVGGDPNQASVSWGGKTYIGGTNMPAFGWTDLQFTAVATGPATVLQFSFRQDYDYFGLGGIQVTPSTTSPPILDILSASVSNQNISFTWSTTPGSNYQAQYTTNLNHAWQNMGAPMLASSNSLSASDGVSNSQRFYRVMLSQ